MAAIKKSKLCCNYSTQRLFDFIYGGKDVVSIQALLQVDVDMDINARDSNGCTPLMLACLKNRVQIVDLLIKSGANVHVKCNRNCTVLHYASIYSSIEIVRTVVKKVFNVDARDINGETALHHASRSGHLEVVQCLLDEGADIDAKSFYNFTPLICAAQVSWTEAANLLLRSRANVDGCQEMLLYYAAGNGWTKLVRSLAKRVPNLNECMCLGETFLYAASSKGHLEVVKCLLEEGADINKKNDFGQRFGETALHPASRNGHLELVRYFVESGADINVKSYNGATPVLLAAQFSHMDVVDLFVHCGTNIDGCKEILLYYAAKSGWTKLVYSLVKKVPNLNKCVSLGETFLYAATSKGHLEIVKCLLKEGADINKKNDYGQWYTEAALHSASRNGHLELVRYFVENGADINVESYNGATPVLLAAELSYMDIVDLFLHCGQNVDGCKEEILYYAAISGWTRIVHSLVKRKPNLNECVYGHTCLHVASTERHLEIVKCLLKEGADVNKRNDDGPKRGETALHSAAENGLLELVKCFIDKGADINVKSDEGATPVVLAALEAHKDVVNLLMQYGANVDATNEFKDNLLHCAALDGWLDIVQSLVKQNYDLEATNSNDMTALDLACLSKEFNIVQCLLQAGARWDTENKHGNSPLTYSLMPGNIEIIKLLIENGAYFKDGDYEKMVNSSLLVLLQDDEFCCQAIMNKLNHDLTRLYKLPVSRSLPCFEIMKIGNGSEVFEAIKQNVIFEIQTKGHCNILEVRPMVLSILSARSVLEYCQKK